MPLFRFHRLLLEDSLKTVITVYSKEELEGILLRQWQSFFSDPDMKIKVEVKPYVYDKRINWDTQIVTSTIYNKNMEEQFSGVEGFLSEPF